MSATSDKLIDLDAMIEAAKSRIGWLEDRVSALELQHRQLEGQLAALRTATAQTSSEGQAVKLAKPGTVYADGSGYGG